MSMKVKIRKVEEITDISLDKLKYLQVSAYSILETIDSIYLSNEKKNNILQTISFLFMSFNIPEEKTAERDLKYIIVACNFIQKYFLNMKKGENDNAR